MISGMPATLDDLKPGDLIGLAIDDSRRVEKIYKSPADDSAGKILQR